MGQKDNINWSFSLKPGLFGQGKNVFKTQNRNLTNCSERWINENLIVGDVNFEVNGVDVGDSYTSILDWSSSFVYCLFFSIFEVSEQEFSYPEHDKKLIIKPLKNRTTLILHEGRKKFSKTQCDMLLLVEKAGELLKAVVNESLREFPDLAQNHDFLKSSIFVQRQVFKAQMQKIMKKNKPHIVKK